MSAKIYCFINERYEGGDEISDTRRSGPDDGDCAVMAVAEDGTELASHYSSSEYWAIHDIGINSMWKHEKYREHYPDGYDLIWCEKPPDDVIERNRALYETVAP